MGLLPYLSGYDNILQNACLCGFNTSYLVVIVGLVSEVTGEEWPGQLWCGLGSDKVVVYNADTWTLEKQVTEARKKVVCYN